MEPELITNLKKLNINIKDKNNQNKSIEQILSELTDTLERLSNNQNSSIEGLLSEVDKTLIRLNREADEISKEISKLKKERWY